MSFFTEFNYLELKLNLTFQKKCDCKSKNLYHLQHADEHISEAFKGSY